MRARALTLRDPGVLPKEVSFEGTAASLSSADVCHTAATSLKMTGGNGGKSILDGIPVLRTDFDEVSVIP